MSQCGESVVHLFHPIPFARVPPSDGNRRWLSILPVFFQSGWVVRRQHRRRIRVRVVVVVGVVVVILRHYQMRLIPDYITLVVLQSSQQHQLFLIVPVYLHSVTEYRDTHGSHRDPVFRFNGRAGKRGTLNGTMIRCAV